MKRKVPLRLAYFSPLPPARSGIADYTVDLLPHLSQLADVTLFTPDPEQVTAVWQPPCPIQPATSYPAHRWQYDLTLYQMGNSDQHDWLYPYSLRYPGVLVLHDYTLHHALAHRTKGQAAYVRELGYSYGLAGIRLAYQIQAQEQPMPLFVVPLHERLLHTNLGFIVHSHYVARRIRPHTGQRPLAVVPQLMPPQTYDSGARTSLPQWPTHWPADGIILATAGYLTASRQLGQSLRAFKQLSERWPIYYLIIGDTGHEVDVMALITELGLTERVHLAGYLPDLAQFSQWLATADIILNLRFPTAGETSAIALRAMAAGKAMMVYDHGWYHELPDSVCYKVSVMDQSALQAGLASLIADPERRGQLGQAALAYVGQHCDPAQVAQQYLDLCQQVLVSQT